jgi:DNA/RNA endonuclease YhcR with UshA esterase domain
MGWEMLQNGLLLNQAQGQFDAMLTIDQNIRFQQNLTGLTISVVVLNAGRNTITELIAIAPAIESTLTSVQPGRFYVVSGP